MTPYGIGVRFAAFFLVILSGTTAVTLTEPDSRFDTAPKTPAMITFRNFNSAVYLPPAGLARELGVGWVRQGFYWNEIEPKKGEWKFGGGDRLITEAHKEGVEVLPLLAYTAPWDTSADSNIFSPPKSGEDWKDFVEHIVARYSAPPFSLRYFQIWNEPTRQARFWTGSDEEFIDRVYLPAAKIIRRHNCYVVFGGWPDSNSLQEFDRVLSYHDAWRWTDILDIHYEGLPAWKYLYDHWVKPGKCKGIWETEIGFNNDPDFIPGNYLPMLNWALQSGWKDPDQYKLFWYAAWGAGRDGPNCLSHTDAKGQVVLSDQGKRLALLHKLLDAGLLTSFSDYAVAPIGVKDSVIGFRSGRRIVIAMLFDKSSSGKVGSISVRLAIAQKPGNVDLVTEDAAPLRLSTHFHKGHLMVKVPLQPALWGGRELAVAYLEIDPSQA